jgi:hypothetical protein
MYQKYLINLTAEEWDNDLPPFIMPLLMFVPGANRSAQSQ